jgi:hypothetical protein
MYYVAEQHLSNSGARISRHHCCLEDRFFLYSQSHFHRAYQANRLLAGVTNADILWNSYVSQSFHKQDEVVLFSCA